MSADMALALALMCGFLALLLGSWSPVHRCKWRMTCPHYKQDQDRIDRERQKWEQREENVRRPQDR